MYVVIRAPIVIYHAVAFLIPAERLCDLDPMTGRVLGRIRVVPRVRVPDARLARALPRHFVLIRHADVRVRRASVRVACFVPRAYLLLQLRTPGIGAGARLRRALLCGLAKRLFLRGFAVEIVRCVTVKCCCIRGGGAAHRIVDVLARDPFVRRTAIRVHRDGVEAAELQSVFGVSAAEIGALSSLIGIEHARLITHTAQR